MEVIVSGSNFNAQVKCNDQFDTKVESMENAVNEKYRIYLYWLKLNLLHCLL